MHLNFIGDELGSVTITSPDGNKTVEYFYNCAHCSNTILLNQGRTRERIRCSSCSGVICEKKPICRQGCTPLNELFNDGFEAGEKWTKLVPDIMSGKTYSPLGE